MATTTSQESSSTPPPFARPYTLSFDIGGTGLKGSVLDANGQMVTDRVRIPTPYPLRPELLVSSLVEISQGLPKADRASAGFPGMIRNGVVFTAPSFSTVAGTGSRIDPDLVATWHGFDLASALATALSLPIRVANDADVQCVAVIEGKGLEMTITLGTGFGTGLAFDGKLLPHMEIAHLQFRKGEDFDAQVGEAARKKIGLERWLKRVEKAIGKMRMLTAFDHLYIGGGNAKRLPAEMLPDDVTVVSNNAGILGGIKLWDQDHIGIGEAT